MRFPADYLYEISPTLKNQTLLHLHFTVFFKLMSYSVIVAFEFEESSFSFPEI